MPASYAHLFKNQEDILQTHSGYDPGAWEIAEYISTQLNAPLFGCHTTRLLVEANRSLDSPQLFSAFSQSLTESEKKRILDKYYFTYRNAVEEAISHMKKPVLHISVHTFTPVWEGKERELDIGLLFDPNRKGENDFCMQWKICLEEKLLGKKICLNEPYLGITDGFTTYLRTRYLEDNYMGIEIEINQQYYLEDKLEDILTSLSISLKKALSKPWFLKF